MTFGPTEWNFAYRVALRVLKAPDQAEDAAQDAMMQAFSARASFAGRAKPRSWLYRIAHNTALTHLRRPHARRYVAADVYDAIEERGRAQDRVDCPERDAIASELADELLVCLADLRDKDRVAFTERFLLGTTERELGQILGVSTNAAKQRAFRARRAVQSHFSAAGFEPTWGGAQ